MPFESLSERFQAAFKKLRGKGKLSEEDVSEALKEMRRALLEADVNFAVTKDFIKKVKEKAVGEEVFGSLNASQTVIKIVRDELTELLGGTQSRITISPKPPTIIMLVGLQGAGKTTTAAKLAKKLKSQGKSPLMVAADVYIRIDLVSHPSQPTLCPRQSQAWPRQQSAKAQVVVMVKGLLQILDRHLSFLQSILSLHLPKVAFWAS